MRGRRTVIRILSAIPQDYATSSLEYRRLAPLTAIGKTSRNISGPAASYGAFRLVEPDRRFHVATVKGARVT